jgi:hypothetical protein
MAMKSRSCVRSGHPSETAREVTDQLLPTKAAYAGFVQAFVGEEYHRAARRAGLSGTTSTTSTRVPWRVGRPSCIAGSRTMYSARLRRSRGESQKLGGKVEVIARFGDKMIRLHAPDR